MDQGHPTISAHLTDWIGQDPQRLEIACVIKALARAAIRISEHVGRGALGGALGATVKEKGGGDDQKALDLQAHRLILEALEGTEVAFVGSEESEGLATVNAGGRFCLAIDPLDGSSNIDTNVSIGTIFSLLPLRANGAADPLASLLRPGAEQIAAGFFVYGPQTSLVLSVGAGTHIYTLDRAVGSFLLAQANVSIPAETREYAINASNARHWNPPIKSYIDDCQQGAQGPRAKDFNMRWIASMVAEAYRILVRGGVYLYPGDGRPGYGEGRLRLVYEASPVAMLVEQAGGAATTGRERILDIVPEAIHQRVPLIFGSRAEVELIARYKADPHQIGDRSPLFSQRGLLRA